MLGRPANLTRRSMHGGRQRWVDFRGSHNATSLVRAFASTSSVHSIHPAAQPCGRIGMSEVPESAEERAAVLNGLLRQAKAAGAAGAWASLCPTTPLCWPPCAVAAAVSTPLPGPLQASTLRRSSRSSSTTTFACGASSTTRGSTRTLPQVMVDGAASLMAPAAGADAAAAARCRCRCTCHQLSPPPCFPAHLAPVPRHHLPADELAHLEDAVRVSNAGLKKLAAAAAPAGER